MSAQLPDNPPPAGENASSSGPAGPRSDHEAPVVPWRSYWLVGVVALLGTVLSLTLAIWFQREAHRLDEARFTQLAQDVGERLDDRVESIEAMLRDLQRMLNEVETPSPEVWEEFMNQVSPQWNSPGILALGYATNTAAPGILARVREMLTNPDPGAARAEFYSLPSELTGPRSWRTWMLEVYREGLFPLEELQATRLVKGREDGAYHLRQLGMPAGAPLLESSNPFYFQQRQGAMELVESVPEQEVTLHAILRDDVKITGRQPVLREQDGSPVMGATMVVPVYDPRRRASTRMLPPDEGRGFERYWLRWNLNRGFLYAPLDFARLLGQIQGPGPLSLRVEIHAADTNETSVASWLNPDDQPTRAGDAGFHPSFSHMHRWLMYGTRWTLFFHTTPLFEQQSARYRAAWAGGWGLLTTALVCWLVGGQVRHRSRERFRAEQLQAARDALQAAQHQREQLSRDLHDGAIQSLYAVQLGLTSASREVKALAPSASDALANSRASLDVVIGELRQFIGHLASVDGRADGGGLCSVLKSLVVRLRMASPAPIELVCDELAEAALTPAQALQLASVARGAISNAIRHAQARHIQVTLRHEEKGVVLTITDDGCGFDANAPQRHGLGLSTMRRRAVEIGAEIDIRSGPAQGTTIAVRVATQAPDGTVGPAR